jgi:hypothetical protein
MVTQHTGLMKISDRLKMTGAVRRLKRVQILPTKAADAEEIQYRGAGKSPNR